MLLRLTTLLVLAAHFVGSPLQANDWLRFRGPNGSGISSSSATMPTEFSDSKNMKWKIDLPGPGHSSPIIVGDKVLLTCWTGYGLESQKQEDLRLHLLCFNRKDGAELWRKEIEPTLPEEVYADMFKENGYATHTPTSDGEHVWAYFGKSGVVCFDLDGNEKWRKNLGKQLDQKRWGSSASPIVYNNVLIVNAAIESNTVYGLNKATGEEIWKQQADNLTSTWSTPVLAKVDDERTDLVLSVPYELWGFDPESGKFLWYCEALEVNSACTSPVTADGVVYWIDSGRSGGGSIAVKAGAKGDAKENVLWQGRDRGRIGCPVIVDEKMYWISGGIANCVSAKTGEKVYQERLSSAGRSAAGNSGGSRRSRGGQDYGSPVVADGKMYYVKRNGDVYVIALGDKFEQLAVNSLGDGGEFSASPAISNGDLFIRSTKTLFCISSE